MCKAFKAVLPAAQLSGASFRQVSTIVLPSDSNAFGRDKQCEIVLVFPGSFVARAFCEHNLEHNHNVAKCVDFSALAPINTFDKCLDVVKKSLQVRAAGLKEVRDRIGSVKNTQKITEAMKLVAAAKVRRAQEAVVNGRPFAENLVKVGLKMYSCKVSSL